MAKEIRGKTEQVDKYTMMTTEPVVGLVCRLAVPSILIMIISALYNMADTFFVGSLGTSQVAAVGVAFPLMNVIQAVGFFFGQGSGNYMSRALGAQDHEGASRMAATGFFSAFIFMSLLALTGILLRTPLVSLLGATETIKPYAKDYLMFILIASPWMVSATVLNQQLRFQGSAAIAMVGMITGAVLNMFLDPLFIFALHLGVKGAAVATMLSQMVSFTILLSYGGSHGGNIPIRPRHFSPSVHRYIEMIRGGVPALIRQGLMSVATIITNHMAGGYGDSAIAAISIVNRVCMFANSVILGFGQGFQPVCGFNYVAKRYDRVKKAFWFCVRVALIGLGTLSCLLAFFAPQVISLFRNDPEVIRIGQRGLRLNSLSLVLGAWVIMNNMMTQTMGKAREASLLASSRQGLFMIPSLFILSPLFGLLGIQLCSPVSDSLSFLFSIPIHRKVMGSLKE